MEVFIKLTRTENCDHYGVAAGAVITLDLEAEYLPCCVSSEIYEGNDRTPMEAKKAQAIAARTYIAAHARAGITIDDTAKYQVFRWKKLTDIPNSVQACQATAGQVLLYDGELITAWYSNSNGGRTRRSDEAWSAYKPWTVSQADPWDVAARAKWGEKPARHGVGMSQMGAAYAAFAGVSCADILRFYYPGTVVAGDYGDDGAREGEALMEYPIVQDFHTKNDCYKAVRIRKKTHITVHSTGTAKNGSLSYRGRWYKWNVPNHKKCAHAFVDWDGIYQTLPWNYQGWLNGVQAGNDCSIAFEICEPSPKDDTPGMAADLYGKTLWLCYTLCKEFDIPPEHVICHAEAHRIGLANNHADVNHWWGKKGTAWEQYTMERLRRELAELLGVAEHFPYPAVVQTTKGGPINLWSVPGDVTSRKRLKEVPNGARVTVEGYSALGGWYLATFDGVTANADGQYLHKVDAMLVAEDEEVAPVVSEEDDEDLTDGAPFDTPLYTLTWPGVTAEIKDKVISVFPDFIVSDAR